MNRIVRAGATGRFQARDELLSHDWCVSIVLPLGVLASRSRLRISGAATCGRLSPTARHPIVAPPRGQGPGCAQRSMLSSAERGQRGSRGWRSPATERSAVITS